jgi:CubicO group peptidase (beta-lactamase class C family)
MEDAGFGPPASPGVEPPDAPWGHTPQPVDPAQAGADNPPALGPAGTVHASLCDMERYLGLYLRAGTDPQGRRLVSQASLEEIYRPRLAGYALGWSVTAPGGERRIEHLGSNTNFACEIIAVPSRGCAVVVMTNRGDVPARNAVAALARDLAALHGF